MDSFYNSIQIYKLQKEMKDTSETQDIEELVEEKQKKPRKLRQNEIFVINKNEKSNSRPSKTTGKNKSY
jgi:hypothetical protein